ncbi:MAG: hypothetical protein MRY49_02745, partial [Candidatus Pacebacteria bacterium]|nr:hypothetical protein [Candidatus Paceibacterota bacterium]
GLLLHAPGTNHWMTILTSGTPGPSRRQREKMIYVPVQHADPKCGPITYWGLCIDNKDLEEYKNK